MSEQEVREFEENIVKGANIAFQRLVRSRRRSDGGRNDRSRSSG